MSQIQIGSWLYNQIQINGVRTTTNVSFKYSLMADINPMEVFINRIPYSMYEHDLIPLFETVGVVAQLRLMMDHNGQNRGFGYIIYVDPDDGYRAITYLDGILVSSWLRLQLTVSRNTRLLSLWNVSDDLDVGEIVDLILEKVDPDEIRVRYRNGSRSFILKFATHRDTAVSLKLLLAGTSDFGTLTRANWYSGESS